MLLRMLVKYTNESASETVIADDRPTTTNNMRIMVVFNESMCSSVRASERFDDYTEIGAE